MKSAAFFATLLAFVNAASLNVVNQCGSDLFLFTQSSFGTINQNVDIAAGTTVNMDISDDWDGAVNVGTNCNSDGSQCDTGGPTWDGTTPFSRAEFNFVCSAIWNLI
jgi:hypothetical protein